MGDRASISFIGGGDESVALFSHWGGVDFQNAAEAYARELCADIYAAGLKPGGISRPLDRLEAQTVMVDFVRWFFQGRTDRVRSDYYFGKDETDGDNSDNGHRAIDLGELFTSVKAEHERITTMTTSVATATKTTKAKKKTAAQWTAAKEAAAKITGYGSTSSIWGKTDVTVFSEIQELLTDLNEGTGKFVLPLDRAMELVTELQKREAYKRLVATL